METYHPKLDENGKKVLIKEPSTPTNSNTWYDPKSITSFTPNSSTPNHLNNVPVNDSKPSEDETYDVKEPYFKPDRTKHTAAGMAVVSGNKVLLTTPTNKFGHLEYTFPKGTQEQGHSLSQTAAKEVWEETGIHAIPTHHLGDYHRSTSVNRMYVGKYIGGNPSKMGWESQATHFIPIDQAHKFLHTAGDQQVLRDLKLHLSRENAKDSVKRLIK